MLKVKVYTFFLGVYTLARIPSSNSWAHLKSCSWHLIPVLYDRHTKTLCYVCSHILLSVWIRVMANSYCSTGWSHTLSFSTRQLTQVDVETVFDYFFPRSQSSGNTDVYCMYPVLLWSKRKYVLLIPLRLPPCLSSFFNCSRMVSRVEL